MSHSAAVVPSAKAPFKIRQVGPYACGPHDLLVKNKVIALHPVDAKIWKLNIPPVQYPAILGTNFGGTVIAIGSDVTAFRVGDQVAGYGHRADGDKYGAFQEVVLMKEERAAKVTEGEDLDVYVSLAGNLAFVVGMLSGTMGLARPSLSGFAPSQNAKILVYGGTSSFGSLAVQYLAQAGYQVVTTTSPQHHGFVSKLGATQVVDHTQSAQDVTEQLVAYGPFDHVIDSISLPPTVAITGNVLAAQEGGELYTVLPPIGPTSLPPGVKRTFDSWNASLLKEENAGLENWAFQKYLPQGIADGKILPVKIEKIGRGLGSLGEGLNRLLSGVSGLKLLVDLDG